MSRREKIINPFDHVGERVRVKSHIKCHPAFKDPGGVIATQRRCCCLEGEYPYGIYVKTEGRTMLCFEFHARDYQLITNKDEKDFTN